MSQPNVTLVRVIPRAGRTDAVLEVLREVVPLVHGEDGCQLYAVNVEENGDLWFVEKWASREHAEQHAQHSPALPILLEKATPLLQGPPELHALVPFPIGDGKGAL